MDTRKKILAVALIAALAGGVVGAFAFRGPGSSTEASTEAALPARAWESPSSEVTSNPDRTYAGTDQIAYRDGFNDGFLSARGGAVSSEPVYSTNQGVRTVTRTRYANNSGTTNYAPRKRSFWDKHRDKLTVAMGAGGGAILGGVIGGKKGAAIGALAGGGGSALYTYKIRKRNQRY
jgi:hypothetical protein